ncbi:MAG: secretin and TonB N-terminal domain-containing protein [bacterium]
MNLKRFIIFILIILFCFGCTGIQKNNENGLAGTEKTLSLKNASLSEDIPLLLREDPDNFPEKPGEPDSTATVAYINEPEEEKQVFLDMDTNNPQEEKRYYISMIDSDLRSVLLSFAKGSQYNIILDPNVNGRISLDLKDISLEDALDNILTPAGYEYRKEGNLIYVSRPTKDTRIFTLNYLATIREGKTIIEAKTPGGVDGDNAEPTKVTSKDKADLWDEIEKGMEHLLSDKGKFFINKMASIIIVTDYAKNLKKIAEFLETVEGTIQRQVLIEATIAEVMLSDDHQTGIDWTYLVGRETSQRFLGDNTRFTLDTTGLMSSSVFEFSFLYKDVDALLKAISEQGKMNIISRPKLTTLNNQKAIIKVGTEEVYFERETETTTTGKTETYTAKFFTVGLLLDVTPQISPEDEITLHIHPVISEKIEDRPYPIGGGTIPIVNIRESSSVVKVKSGHTAVLAGLMLEKDVRNASGVPVLMKIPLLGNLFSYSKNEKTKTELVITLTPRILFGKEMDEYRDETLKEMSDLQDYRPRRRL